MDSTKVENEFRFNHLENTYPTFMF